MIHKPEYVKELLRKYLEGTASPLEQARWHAARRIYTDEEILNMTAEILEEVTEAVTSSEMNEQANLLGNTYKRPPKKNYQLNHWWIHNRAAAVVAAVVLVAGILFIILKNVNERMTSAGCIDGKPNQVIPTSVFYCLLSFGRDSVLKIDSSRRGVIARSRNIAVTQNLPGILQVEFTAGALFGDTNEAGTLSISTDPGQQYLVVLPDGTKIRLNASSFVRLPVSEYYPNTSVVIDVGGEAYIETAANHDNPLTIQTGNATASANNAVFNIRASDGFTSAIVVKGQFVLSNPAGKNITLFCPGDKGYFVAFSQAAGVHRDTMALVRSQDIVQELMWMKTERRYDYTSLRTFATDMSRWYGFTIKNINCIPENIRISASICYKAPLHDALAIFKKAGLTVYEEKDVISFCDPTKNKLQKQKNATAYNARKYRYYQ